MEIRYLVKRTLAATPANVNNPGLVTVYVYGKGEEILYEDGSYDGFFDKNWLTAWQILDKGYRRESDARRSYIYRTAHSDYAWTCTVEIVRYEIETPVSSPPWIASGFVG